MSLHIKLLGTFRIENENGDPSEVMKWSKGCAMLAYLAIAGQAQNRELLADLLWDSASTAQSLQNLRKLLSRMHNSLPELKVTRKQVTFRAETAVTCDYLSLIKAIASGSIQEIDTALNLYEGELLHGFYLHNATRFNEWLLLEREQLRQQVVAANRQVCFAYTEQQAWDKGVAAAKRWLALDALDEEALRYLMQMQAADEQIEAALQQYGLTRQRLGHELGVEPEQATQAVAQQLVRLQEKLPAWKINYTQVKWPKKDKVAEPGSLPPLSLIPYQRNINFTGRRESLLHLAQTLLPWPETGKNFDRNLAITGMGGIGKTQLAVEFCYRYGRYFPGGIFWMSFADARNVPAEVAAIGGERGLGLYREADKFSLIDQVGRVRQAWQEPIPRLLIFDNCEAEDLLAEWIPVTGGCRVLLTSRRANWSRELQVSEWPLPVLDLPESVAFLRQLAPDLHRDDAAEIATELGRLPLALHLAGNFLNCYSQVTTTRYLEQIREQGVLEHPSLHGRGTAFSPTDHELNVFRTFDINVRQLDPGNEIDALARQLLTHTAQFAPGEPIARDLLLATVAAETELMALLLAEDALTRLVTLGLVRADGQKTITIHRLLLFFTEMVLPDKLRAQKAVENTIWQKVSEVWQKETNLSTLPFAPVHLRHVADAAFGRRDATTARLSHAWGRYLLDLSAYVQCQDVLEKALTIFEEVGYEYHPDLADLLMTLGTLKWQMKTVEDAWPNYERAHNIYNKALGPGHLKTAQSFNNLGILHARSGNYEEARSYYEQALAAFDQIPNINPAEIARTLYNLGLLFNRVGDFAQAKALHERALIVREEVLAADNIYIIQSLNSIGVANYLRGEYSEALSFFERSLRASQEKFGQVHLYTALALNNIGKTLTRLGQYKEAREPLSQSLVIRQKLYPPDHPNIGRSLSNLGDLHLQAGAYTEAAAQLEKALQIQLVAQPEHSQTADTLNHLGDLHLQQGDLEPAKPLLDQALAIREEVQGTKHPDVAHTLISLGEYFATIGDTASAKTHYEQAVTILEGKVADTHSDLKRVRHHISE